MEVNTHSETPHAHDLGKYTYSNYDVSCTGDIGTIVSWNEKQHLNYFKRCETEIPNTGTRK